MIRKNAHLLFQSPRSDSSNEVDSQNESPKSIGNCWLVKKLGQNICDDECLGLKLTRPRKNEEEYEPPNSILTLFRSRSVLPHRDERKPIVLDDVEGFVNH